MNTYSIPENNKGITDQLEQMIKRKMLVHAFMFIGGSGEDRTALAYYFAKTLLCRQAAEKPCNICVSCRSFDDSNNEDFIAVRKNEDRVYITVDDVNQLQARLQYKPLGEKYVIIIEDAQLMHPAAQNKLLKLLEEPVSPAVFILLSERRDAMLPTVLSRCCSYQLEEAELSFDEDSEAMAAEMFRLCREGAGFYKKKNCLSPIFIRKDGQRELALAFLSAFERKIRLEAETDPKLCLSLASEAAKARSSVNMVYNVNYTLKQMCLNI